MVATRGIVAGVSIMGTLQNHGKLGVQRSRASGSGAAVIGYRPHSLHKPGS